MIHQHLLERGMVDSATMLQKEAKLNYSSASRAMHSQLGGYRTPSNTSVQARVSRLKLIYVFHVSEKYKS